MEHYKDDTVKNMTDMLEKIDLYINQGNELQESALEFGEQMELVMSSKLDIKHVQALNKKMGNIIRNLERYDEMQEMIKALEAKIDSVEKMQNQYIEKIDELTQRLDIVKNFEQPEIKFELPELPDLNFDYEGLKDSVETIIQKELNLYLNNILQIEDKNKNEIIHSINSRLEQMQMTKYVPIPTGNVIKGISSNKRG